MCSIDTCGEKPHPMRPIFFDTDHDEATTAKTLKKNENVASTVGDTPRGQEGSGAEYRVGQPSCKPLSYYLEAKVSFAAATATSTKCTKEETRAPPRTTVIHIPIEINTTLFTKNATLYKIPQFQFVAS